MHKNLLIIGLSGLTFLFYLNCASTIGNGESYYKISANSIDTCDGNYADEISIIKNKSIDDITIADIARLRCLKYQSTSFGDSIIWNKYRKALEDSSYADILLYGEELLNSDFANPRLHDAMANAADALGENEKYKSHLQYVIKHFQSFALLGNGKSIESPLQVFAIGEEYEWLNLMGYSRGVQSKVVKDGRHFDVHKCKNKDGVKSQVFFDITGYWYYYHKMFTDTTRTNRTIILY